MKNPWSLTTAETEVMDFFIVTGCRKGVATDSPAAAA